MKRIRRLEDQVVNQIAAGEVVERPASVLKELVENAIDAGATKISVDLEDGGIKLLAVSDNGTGMVAEDAKLAIERHATSKISSIEDLFALGSMGFRGEALASIASVSRFTLRTQPADELGTELKVEGGDVQPAGQWNGPQGTTILVEDLFFNVPARRQFLRKASTEYAHCLDYIQALSLANLDIGLELTHNGKATFSVAENADLTPEARMRQRFSEVLGRAVDELVFITRKDKVGEIKGLISPPGREKSTTKSQFFFVNKRWVKDKVVRFGVMRGYHSHLLKGKHPVVHLELTIDPALVDVNVHPSKTELRFQYREEVQNLVAVAIREGLRQGAWARLTEDKPVGNERPKALFDTPPQVVLPPRSNEQPADVGGQSFSVRPQFGKSAAYRPRPPDDSHYEERSAKKSWASQHGWDLLPETSVSVARSASEDEHIPWSQLNFLGTFAKCYLMFEHSDRMLVVDQHAFHERILFEKLCADTALLGRSQRLLMPEELVLDATNLAVLDELSGSLAKLGFDYKVLNETSLEVYAVPALLTKRDREELFCSLSADEERDYTLETNAGVNQHLLATMACHAAVRAGEELSGEDLTVLLSEAAEVDFYHNCPHGRRVFRWWKVSQVAAWFDR